MKCFGILLASFAVFGLAHGLNDTSSADADSPLPDPSSTGIKIRDPLVAIGSETTMKKPVAQMRSSDDAMLEAFTNFLQPKIFNQNQVKSNQPTQSAATTPYSIPQVFPVQQPGFQADPSQQQRYPYQDPSQQINPYGQAAPGTYNSPQVVDPRMMGVPNAGIPAGQGMF
jgi:hypothetical protein